MENIQDRLVKDRASVTWEHIMLMFGNTPDYDLTAVRQAYLVGRGLDTQRTAVNLIMCSMPWTPEANDHAIVFWMVSGDVTYLRTMLRRMREHALTEASGIWALASLKRQYGEHFPLTADDIHNQKYDDSDQEDAD